MAQSLKLQTRQTIRHKLSSLWENSEVLLQGQIGYQTDTGLWKIGDNLGTPWGQLSYQSLGLNFTNVDGVNNLNKVLKDLKILNEYFHLGGEQ